MTTLIDTEAAVEVPRKPGCDIKVLGVGGAGGNAVSHLAAQEFPGVAFAVLHTDAMALRQFNVGTKLSLGSHKMRGLGAGGDPARGRAAAEEDESAIRALVADSNIVFIIAGLGGGTGTGASTVVARIAKECGALVLAIVITPFEVEGGKRMRQAQLGLQELKSAADGVIVLPNQRMFKLVDEKTPLVEALQITNGLIAQGVRGIWRLLSRPGLIHVNFADLCAVTQGRHAESALATAEARGENRAREVIEKLLGHPLIDGGAALADASGVLVCIGGGPSLSLAEVNRVMDQIHRHCEGANIILGAAVDEELGDALSVTLLAAKSTGKTGLPAAPAELQKMVALQATETGNGASPAPGMPSDRPVEAVPAASLAARGGRGRKGRSGSNQGQLALEMVAKGRFKEIEPTIHQGQDLDLPTYIRRGVALN
jgi:cell division protein FtsZ